MAKTDFLTDEWFDQVLALKDEMGDMEIPPAIKDLVLNITVTSDEGEVAMCMNGGNFQKGHVDGAPTKMTLPKDLALRLFLENDQSAAMNGFMAGDLKIEGDMSKMMAMQTVQPSADQEALRAKIIEITNV